MTDHLMCNPTVIPPSVPAVERVCDMCGTAVWVSRSMLLEVDAGNLLPACLECAEKHMDENGCETKLHPRQVPELVALGILEYAEGFVDITNAIHQLRRSQS